MPMYEYKCGQCGQVFEIIQRFSDDPLSTHEACGGAVERLVSAPALQFKGSGWYITDYARGNGKAPKNGDTSANAGSSAETKAPATSSTDSTSSSTPSSTDTKK